MSLKTVCQVKEASYRKYMFIIPSQEMAVIGGSKRQRVDERLPKAGARGGGGGSCPTERQCYSVDPNHTR